MEEEQYADSDANLREEEVAESLETFGSKVEEADHLPNSRGATINEDCQELARALRSDQETVTGEVFGELFFTLAEAFGDLPRVELRHAGTVNESLTQILFMLGEADVHRPTE